MHLQIQYLEICFQLLSAVSVVGNTEKEHRRDVVLTNAKVFSHRYKSHFLPVNVLILCQILLLSMHHFYTCSVLWRLIFRGIWQAVLTNLFEDWTHSNVIYGLNTLKKKPFEVLQDPFFQILFFRTLSPYTSLENFPLGISPLIPSFIKSWFSDTVLACLQQLTVNHKTKWKTPFSQNRQMNKDIILPKPIVSAISSLPSSRTECPMGTQPSTPFTAILEVSPSVLFFHDKWTE